MKKNKSVQIMAILALLGIVISVVGTGILVLTTPKEVETYNYNYNPSEEKQKTIVGNNTEIKTLTGETK